MRSESDNAVQITSNCAMSFTVSYMIAGIMCAVSGAAHLGKPAVVPRAKDVNLVLSQSPWWLD